MKDIKIKGQSIQDLLTWVTSELEPPIIVDKQTKYVLEAFKESLEKLEIIQDLLKKVCL